MAPRTHDIAVSVSCRTILGLWKVFGTQRETTINILQLLTGILEQHCTTDMREMTPQHVLVSMREERGLRNHWALGADLKIKGHLQGGGR